MCKIVCNRSGVFTWQLCLVDSVGDGSTSETEALRRQIWEQAKLIEHMKETENVEGSSSTLNSLQKQVLNRDYTISTLRYLVLSLQNQAES